MADLQEWPTAQVLLYYNSEQQHGAVRAEIKTAVQKYVRKMDNSWNRETVNLLDYTVFISVTSCESRDIVR